MIAVFIIALLCLYGGIKVNAYEYTPDDILFMGRVVQHEAGNQSELGQRLVIDTILNRVDSKEFPNTVTEVLTQPGQYCNPKEKPPIYIYKFIEDEIRLRTNSQVLWYRTNKYHSYGNPIIKEGNHYFSGR